VVARLYERGWRQGFRLIGFPGPARECTWHCSTCSTQRAVSGLVHWQILSVGTVGGGVAAGPAAAAAAGLACSASLMMASSMGLASSPKLAASSSIYACCTDSWRCRVRAWEYTALHAAATAAAGLLIDASCGSGLFTRLFAASGHISAVVALDFSEAMLRQAQNYLQADKAVAASRYSRFQNYVPSGSLIYSCICKRLTSYGAHSVYHPNCVVQNNQAACRTEHGQPQCRCSSTCCCRTTATAP
jgi:hypothetical protein